MTDSRTATQIIKDSRTRVFTFSEAIEFMEYLKKQGTHHTVNWVSAKTGNPVVIGYTK